MNPTPQTVEVSLSDDEKAKLAQIDGSIHFWSVEHTKAILRAEEFRETVRSLYAARNHLLKDAATNNGIPADSIKQMSFDGDGKLQVTHMVKSQDNGVPVS